MITTPLHELQEKAKQWLLEREATPYYECRGGFLCDDPGMGKTLSLLSMIFQKQTRSITLVVSPSNVIDVWFQEIIKHTDLAQNRILIYHGSKRKQTTAAFFSTHDLLPSEMRPRRLETGKPNAWRKRPWKKLGACFVRSKPDSGRVSRGARIGVCPKGPVGPRPSEKIVVKEREGSVSADSSPGRRRRRATVSASWRAGTRGLSSRPNPGEVSKLPS